MSPLACIGIFQKLPTQTLARLERGATFLEPHSGIELFAEGDVADAVYAITSGAGFIRIGSIDRRTKRLMVEVLTVGDTFGEIGVIDPGPRTATAFVDGRVRLSRIPAQTFMTVLHETPELGEALAVMLSRRLRRTYALFQDATFERLDARLARQLLYLAKLRGRRTQSGVVVATRLNQAELADLLGATTRSIITILNEWRERGLVIYDAPRAQLTLCDETKLQELIEAGD